MAPPVAVVTGMLASYNVGGVVWDYGQYALGLERLGFDVYYLEDTGWKSFDPDVGDYGESYDYGSRFTAESLALLSPTLGGRWHVLGMDGVAHGMPRDEMLEVIHGADLFLNVSGATLLRPAYLSSRCKVLIDTDPGWNQFRNFRLWDEAETGWYGSAGWRAHDHYLTYATRMGHDACALPSLGVDWHPTRPPVVIDRWCPEPPGSTWTTVMTWNNFAETIEHKGTVYGTKEREFERVEDLPSRTDVRLEVAVGGVGAPMEQWRSRGWSVRESLSISRSATDYQSYVQQSRGELSVAKNVYVATVSGWFSCRSVCYLAAGRPVVVQDTGFSEVIPTGDGLLAFTDGDEALAALAEVERDYDHHAAAARQVARDQFSSDVVLCRLLEDVGLG